MPIDGEAAADVGAEGGGHRRGMLFAAPGGAGYSEAAAGMRQETPVPARPQ